MSGYETIKLPGCSSTTAIIGQRAPSLASFTHDSPAGPTGDSGGWWLAHERVPHSGVEAVHRRHLLPSPGLLRPPGVCHCSQEHRRAGTYARVSGRVYWIIEGPRTSVGQPKMKYWKLHESHKNDVKKKCASHMSICPKILHFEQLLKHSISKFGGGVNSILWG